MKKLLIAVLLTFYSFSAGHSAVLTFDDLPNSTTLLPSGYGGFTWNNSSLSFEAFALVSGSQCVSGWQGGEWPNYWWSISSEALFDFEGAYFTGVYPNYGDRITLNAYNGGEQIWSGKFDIGLSPTWVKPDLHDVEKIEIISSDGFPIYMDNFTYAMVTSPIPEPSTFVLMVIGFIGMAFIWRKKQRHV